MAGRFLADGGRNVNRIRSRIRYKLAARDIGIAISTWYPSKLFESSNYDSGSHRIINFSEYRLILFHRNTEEEEERL